MDEISASLLPKMTTDISIERNGSKVVIETKYYKEVLISHYGLEKYHSQHFYQLFSYLKNLEAKGGANQNCSGVLLYPTVDKEIKGEGLEMGRHKVIVRTIKLNQDWNLIHRDLIDLLESAF